MSTNSSIAVQHADGSISQVYCHWDGDLDWNGKHLVKYYNSQEIAQDLVELGSISTLQEFMYPDPKYPHTFNRAQEKVTVFYHRDRGDDLDVMRYDNMEHYKKSGQLEEFNYLFSNGKWSCITYYGKKYPDLAVTLAVNELS